NPARESVAVVMGRMIPFWERMLGVGAGRPFSVPLAVVVTKMDAMAAHYKGSVDDMKGTYADMEEAAEIACQESARVRQFLMDAGLGSFVSNVESRFQTLAFFAVSALGRAGQSGSRTAFRSKGVLAPIVWVCHSAGALTDASNMRQSL